MPGRGRTPTGPAQTLLGLQTAPRSLVRSPGAARRPVSIVYRVEAVLESCLGRGYVPEREDLHNLLLLSLKRAIRWLSLKARNIKQ